MESALGLLILEGLYSDTLDLFIRWFLSHVQTGLIEVKARLLRQELSWWHLSSLLPIIRLLPWVRVMPLLGVSGWGTTSS